MASHGVFILIHSLNFFGWLKKHVTRRGITMLIRFFLVVLVAVMVFALVFLFLSGKTKWSGRSLTLLDPTYAKKYIPIIASVSEHQATTCNSYFIIIRVIVLFRSPFLSVVHTRRFILLLQECNRNKIICSHLYSFCSLLCICYGETIIGVGSSSEYHGRYRYS